MILCSCKVLTRERILETAARLVAARPGRPVTPGQVFRALGLKAQCAVCFPLIRTLLAQNGYAVTCPEPLATAAEEDDGAVVPLRRRRS
jgi:bacterioferritin-associated ferredoxin